LKLGWWLLTILYSGGIWWLSSRTGSQVGIPAPWDKLVHLLEFALLGFLAARATGSARGGFVFAAVWGAVDEIHQAFVPLRSSGLDDWLADLIGAFLGAMLGGLQVRHSQRAPEARASIKQRH
jgi:VanZ family protein